MNVMSNPITGPLQCDRSGDEVAARINNPPAKINPPAHDAYSLASGPRAGTTTNQSAFEDGREEENEQFFL